MTAIAGIVSFRPDRSLDRLCHSSLEAQSAYGTGRPSVRCIDDVALGIDLFPTLPEDKFDCQPLANGRCLLIADIRLDNRDELLLQLGRSAGQFKEVADADILLQSWLRWKEKCLDRLVGSFAFAVFDRDRRQLILARDTVGARPLAYRAENGVLRFASMPSGVVAPELLKSDLCAITAGLTGAPTSHDRSCFEHVRVLPPGHFLQFTPAGISLRRYWEPARSYARNRSFDNTVAEYRERLDLAVTANMRRRSPTIALQLSSGYDSSAVTGTAARLQRPGDRLIAFTSAPAPGFDLLQFRGRIADEFAIAAETAAALNIPHVIVRDGTPLLNAMHGYTRWYQQPVANIFNQGWWQEISSRASAMGAGSLLTAATGNLTISFGGLPVLAYWLRTGRWLRWLSEARAAKRSNDARWRGVLFASFAPWLPARFIRELEQAFRGAAADGETCFLRREAIERYSHFWDAGDEWGLTGDPFADRIKFIRASDFGHHRKGLLGQTGIDERDPTADRRLIEFCLSMPPEQLLDKGMFKPAARAALADRVPRQILQLRRRGYQGADWAARLRSNDMLEIVEEISPSPAAEVLDLEQMRRAIASWPRMERSNAVRTAALGRSLTDALAAGHFVAEVQRNPLLIGKAIEPRTLASPPGGRSTRF